ncbi:hypothetical protein TNCV_3386291 [Trichonephila clavipes]|nr:hypothetical protein TNCV_3386291 [Trichonephila clavipes]
MLCRAFKADHTTSKKIRYGFITVKSITLIGLKSPWASLQYICSLPSTAPSLDVTSTQESNALDARGQDAMNFSSNFEKYPNGCRRREWLPASSPRIFEYQNGHQVAIYDDRVTK